MASTKVEAGVGEQIRREVRVSGLADARPPSLEAVERRRFQVWGTALVAVLAVAAAIVVVSVWPELFRRASSLPPAITRIGLLALAVAFCVYAVEKERSLRRLSRLLVEERVLTAALSNRLKDLSALLSVGKAINSVLEAQDVLDVILHSALELLRGEEGSIMLWEDAAHLRVVCSRGNEYAVGARVRIGEGIAGAVAQERKPLLISGPADRGAFPNLPERERIPHSAMSVPLIHRQELLGVLNVNASTARSYSEYDLRALTLFAEHAAVAIANARLYDAERKRVNELLQVNQIKSEFVGTVSHELRTPLTSILGSVATIRHLDLDQEQKDGLLEVIERQGHRLLRLIEQFLTAARLEKEGLDEASAPVDVAELVRAVARESELAGRPVQMDLPDSCQVIGDPDALQQVLVNLIDNAYKHGSPPVLVQVEQNGSHAIVSVLDSGPGVAAGDRESIFRRFTRLEEADDREGVGLGLSIVRELVTASGGRVWVEDAPGGGAAFRVTLPIPAVDRIVR